MGKYVNKESLTQALSINLNMSKKDAAFAVDLIFNEMSDALANDGQVSLKFLIVNQEWESILSQKKE
jgi:DNA-binding protein HU-beta